MANKQINELNVLIRALEDDLFITYNVDSTSSEKSFKITLADLRKSINEPLQIAYDTTSGLQVNHLDYVTFDTTLPNPPWSIGKLFWDSYNYTLGIYNEISDVTLQVGQETFIRVRNESGGQIDNGEVCYVSGSSGNLPTVELAQANDHDKIFNLGMATHDIPNNTTGYMTVRGIVRGIDTSSWSAGDKLFLSHTTPGALITTQPPAPYYVAFVGRVVVDDNSEGSILVNPGHHGGLNELNDVSVTDAEVDNSILVWDLPTGIWSSSHIVSTDGSLSGNSNLNIPTEQAVKTYVDAQGWTYTNITATTSGTAITLTSSIPSTAEDIEVIFNGVSTSSNGQPPILRLGDAGGIEPTGYSGVVEGASVTDGFYTVKTTGWAATDLFTGRMRIIRTHPSVNTWVAESRGNNGSSNNLYSGVKTTSQVLTTVQLTTPGGAATFDAGSITVRYK